MIKHFTFIGSVALICAAQLTMFAQEKVPTIGQSLEGAWISVILPPGASEYVPFGLGTFHPNGTYLGSTTDPSHTSHHGVWLRTGDRKFILTSMFFTRDDKGVVNGIVKTRILITLAEDLKSYEASVDRVIMDTAGREVQVITGIRGRSVRLELETQRNPVQP